MKFYKFACLVLTLILVEKSNCVPITDFKEVIANHQIIRPKRSPFEENEIENMATKNNVDKTMLNYHEFVNSNKNHNSKRQTIYNERKWHTTNLTYRFDHKKNELIVKEQGNIRRLIREAFNVWEKDSVLRFTELNTGTADIMISFEEPDHSHIDQFVFPNKTMGHAFPPGRGLGGDIHLNLLVNWDFERSYSSKPEDDKISLFTILLHFIGQSLGLRPSNDKESVMSRYYTSNISTLKANDIREIQRIYGVPPNK